jgi:hypothetical protein
MDVLGALVACANYDSALDIIERLASEQLPTAVCPANTQNSRGAGKEVRPKTLTEVELLRGLRC